MTVQERDLIVFGSGPGGYVAAIRASQLGRKVSIIERESLGGVCLNWGCIPSKSLLRAAQLYHDMKRSKEFGFTTGDIQIDFPRVNQRSREVAGKLSGGVTSLMKKYKVEVIMGNGALEGPHKISVKDSAGKNTVYTYKDIIIATGARPRPFPGIDIDGKLFHTYRTMLEFKTQPKKLLVIGAGAIGIEFAYFFNALGTHVTVVEMVDQILPVEDTEIAQSLQKLLTKQGLVIKTGASVQNLKRDGDTATATIKTKDGEEAWTGDCVLCSIGIIPNTDGIGLEKVGIKTDRGIVVVDEFLRTNVDHHFAIGDCAGMPALAHKASHEGIIAAEAACGEAENPMHYDNIPSCTYCQPQVASVGLTERAVKEKGIKYKVAKIPFLAIGKAIAMGEPDGMIKAIISEDVGEVLGVHILHSEATELIAEAAIIRSHEGIAASVIETIHPHPTLSESMGEVFALALGRPVNF